MFIDHCQVHFALRQERNVCDAIARHVAIVLKFNNPHFGADTALLAEGENCHALEL